MSFWAFDACLFVNEDLNDTADLLERQRLHVIPHMVTTHPTTDVYRCKADKGKIQIPIQSYLYLFTPSQLAFGCKIVIVDIIIIILFLLNLHINLNNILNRKDTAW